MENFIINVAEIEEMQTINDRNSLDQLFDKAKRTLVGGGMVELVRKQFGRSEKFDELTTLEDLADYKKNVYKYLD